MWDICVVLMRVQAYRKHLDEVLCQTYPELAQYLVDPAAQPSEPSTAAAAPAEVMDHPMSHEP